MVHDSQRMAGMPVDTSQEQQALQQALRESAGQLADDAQHCARSWHTRWLDSALEQRISALSAELVRYLEGLRQEFGRAGGPSPPQVSLLLGALLGTADMPGPLARLQGLTGNDPETLSLEGQRLLSEVDALFIQLNGLRAQWQEYLSLLAAPEPLTTRHPTQPFLPGDPLEREPLLSDEGIRLPPLPLKPPRYVLPHALPAARPFFAEEEDGLPRQPPTLVTDNLLPPPAISPGVSVRQGVRGTLRVMLTLGAVLLLIVFLAYVAVSHLPLSDNPTAHPPVPTQMVATTAPEPTNTPLPQPTATTLQPTATTPAATSTAPPAPGSTQLSVNPQVLLVPCPGNGAATLQLVDTGGQALDWTATPDAAGILLDGAASASGHLTPSAVTLVSVTAQTQHAQGTISITYTGGSGPIAVTYMVNC